MTPSTVLLQEKVEEAYMGRVFGVIPEISIITRYTQKLPTIPSATIISPIPNVDNAMVCTRLSNPPHEDMSTPPRSIPEEKAISIAVKRHISSPKLLVT